MLPILLRVRPSWFALLLVIGNFAMPAAHGQISQWTNGAGGLYSVPENWNPQAIPGVTNSLVFTNSGSYPINFDLSVTNAAADFRNGSVTQLVSHPGGWFLTNGWKVGESAGTSRVYHATGLLSVTNETGTGSVLVGGMGTGELAFRGGNMVADRLDATNGIRSLISAGAGSLTLLKGSIFNLSNDLILGSIASNWFTWNLKGGTNRVVTGPFEYGGLTLGISSGTGRAHINMEGSNTLLSVAGLDGYGSNTLSLRNGALLSTRSVQWGLQSRGSNNVVVIADPGSAWVNDYLFYFGMHAGYQTMIISNGAVFRTGGNQFGDQQFHAFSNPGNRIIINGSNSVFQSVGPAELGLVWGSPIRDYDNLLLVTNGGRLLLNQLDFGATNSFPGCVVEIANGEMTINSLVFSVGTIRLKEGRGTIGSLTMNGGTNALFDVFGTLRVGHSGSLSDGDLRIGSLNATISSLNGGLRLGSWQLGSQPGANGEVTMIGGEAYVTNASQNAQIGVGVAGNGVLRVNGGQVKTDQLWIGTSTGGTGAVHISSSNAVVQTLNLTCGTGGTVICSNYAVLQMNECAGPVGSVVVSNATLRFAISAPALADQAIHARDAVISFSSPNAPADLNDPAVLGRIQRSGRTTLELNNTTNAYINSLAFVPGSSAQWSAIALVNGATRLQASTISFESNAVLTASNTVANVSGTVTHRGRILVSNSTLRFIDSVTFGESTVLEGANGLLIFNGGLQLPTNDIVVPSGVLIQAQSITSLGGRLILNGGGVVPADDGSIPPAITIQNGWITYLDHPSAPVEPPAGVNWTGWLGLELIRSTNQTIFSKSFLGGGNGYERLRLGAGSRWNSTELLVGAGCFIQYADPTAVFRPGRLQVVAGGTFLDETGGMTCIPFDMEVTDPASAWLSKGVICVGTTPAPVLVQKGKLFSNFGTINGNGNVKLSQPGATWIATNYLSLNQNSRLELMEGASLFSANLSLAGSAGTVLSGAGTTAVVSNLMLGGIASRFLITNAAALVSSNATIGSIATTVRFDLSGLNSSWKNFGPLSIAGASPFIGSNSVNTLTISDEAVLSTASLSVGNGFGRARLTLNNGQIFVTNSAGNSVLSLGSEFEMNSGFLRADGLVASSVTAPAIKIQAGTAEWAGSDFATGVKLQIGDSTNLARFNVLGGTNTLRGGLDVLRFATLKGSGVIIGSVTNRGLLNPGALTIRSNLILTATSETLFRISAPPGSAQNSSLVVTGQVSFVPGPVTLGGKLTISVENGWIPSNSETYVLMRHGPVTSNFSNILSGQRLLTRDQLGSFQVEDTGTALLAKNYQSEDVDGDGFNDSWTIQYFGTASLAPGTAPNQRDGDLDGDGLSNRHEYFLNTNPADPGSNLFLSATRTAEGRASIRFPYHSARAYSIVLSSDLISWTEVPANDLQIDQNGIATWIDYSGPISGRYYRLAVR